MLRRKKNQHQRVEEESRFLSALPGGWISTAEEARWQILEVLLCVCMSAPAALPSATSAAHEAGL